MLSYLSQLMDGKSQTKEKEKYIFKPCQKGWHVDIFQKMEITEKIFFN